MYYPIYPVYEIVYEAVNPNSILLLSPNKKVGSWSFITADKILILKKMKMNWFHNDVI